MRWFGRALAVLVACVVASTLLLAMLLVLGMNAQKLQANVFEIGLLRAHAVPERKIVGIYALEGPVVGGIALAVATVVQLVCASAVRTGLAEAFALDVGALAGGAAVGPLGLVAAVVLVSTIIENRGYSIMSPRFWILPDSGS